MNERRALNKIEQHAFDIVCAEKNTREDWEDLYYSIEEYKRRFIIRHIKAHLEEKNK